MARRPSNDTGTRPVSMADVARAAGVSQQTVSRVANGLPNVNEQTRQRVQAAMQELGFRPSYAVARCAMAVTIRSACASTMSPSLATSQ